MTFLPPMHSRLSFFPPFSNREKKTLIEIKRKKKMRAIPYWNQVPDPISPRRSKQREIPVRVRERWLNTNRKQSLFFDPAKKKGRKKKNKNKIERERGREERDEGKRERGTYESGSSGMCFGQCFIYFVIVVLVTFLSVFFSPLYSFFFLKFKTKRDFFLKLFGLNKKKQISENKLRSFSINKLKIMWFSL